ncbi:Rrf2 family transcriptional regulator [Variovorax ginsengisoli]|uniref:Rrf2 family transcriptional regulator n=1 Tax=Variovorax ginsengisoli TaxID=363844 RepID=A0ABT8S8B1_9BURK|nr:Rrf2 family transcriptional regulator [Variovorax ginsengisoli]MDN8615984.1 Rrf2 family transcriptional regulator [Variovorax ginsengisoli]MDO1535154.1 Rrf2 family transcriptional regulator [Variovorax ginsengisoli]
MRLTTKGRFAVTAMIDVALNGRTGPVNLSSIHQRQRISLSYLEQLFGKLRRQGLVESTRGPGGGYSLGRQASAISVAEIILSIEDETELKNRAQRPDAPGAVHRCTTDELWESVNRRAVEFLESITLQSLVDEQISKGVRAARKTSVPVLPGRVKSPPVNAPNSVFAMGALLAKR